ncbi:MAG: low molecular weight phosphatase family protein [Clostridiales bacterium]|nr:low molecular weight phosphatase family protein [Clostridiales bacterium]
MNKPLKIAFCCVGNTCRSPMAERVWNATRKILPEAESFGLNARVGECTSPFALTVMKERGYEGVKRPVTPVKAVDLTAFTHIVCMEHGQKQALLPFVKEETQVLSAKDLVGQDILDVYGKELADYQGALTQIEKLVKKLQELLNKEIL